MISNLLTGKQVNLIVPARHFWMSKYFNMIFDWKDLLIMEHKYIDQCNSKTIPI